jgi:hypothetical protein
MSDRPTKEG